MPGDVVFLSGTVRLTLAGNRGVRSPGSFHARNFINI